MRFNQTEKLGLIEADKAVTKELGWIYRDQPLIDVGVDAMIEECRDGNPTGKFIAAQIKSGESNFYIGDQQLVYYVSNVHYNYWTNLNVPIIMICYLPGKDVCYWQQIGKKTLIKTNKKWKLNIPYKNVLNSKSKKPLEQLLMKSTGSVDFGEIYNLNKNEEISPHMGVMAETIVCVTRINNIIEYTGKNAAQFAEKNHVISKDGNISPQLLGAVKLQGRSFAFAAKRLMLEINLYSNVCPDELLALEKLIYSAADRNEKIPQEIIDVISSMPRSIDKAIHGVSVMKNSVSEVRSPFSVLNESLEKLEESLSMTISEYESSKELLESIGGSILETQRVHE